MAARPKTFWSDRPAVGERRASHFDPIGLRQEADIIHAATRAGVSWSDLHTMRLWEIWAAIGGHLLPEGEDHTTDRVIAESEDAAQRFADARARKAEKAAKLRTERQTKRRGG